MFCCCFFLSFCFVQNFFSWRGWFIFSTCLCFFNVFLSFLYFKYCFYTQKNTTTTNADAAAGDDKLLFMLFFFFCCYYYYCCFANCFVCLVSDDVGFAVFCVSFHFFLVLFFFFPFFFLMSFFMLCCRFRKSRFCDHVRSRNFSIMMVEREKETKRKAEYFFLFVLFLFFVVVSLLSSSRNTQ